MAEIRYTRKLDTNGRILIPIKLREKLGMECGKEYTFEEREIDGFKYLCINCGQIVSPLEQAKKIVQAAGFKVVENSD